MGLERQEDEEIEIIPHEIRNRTKMISVMGMRAELSREMFRK